MQTFLPCPSFTQSAQILDRARLGKQRLEVLQLLKALTGESSGWATHPAARMWAGHEHCLAFYGDVICLEWIRRGYKDTTRPKIQAFYTHPLVLKSSGRKPEWAEGFHESHRSNLLRKMPEYYEQFGWTEPPDLPYVWPRESGK